MEGQALVRILGELQMMADLNNPDLTLKYRALARGEKGFGKILGLLKGISIYNYDFLFYFFIFIITKPFSIP